MHFLAIFICLHALASARSLTGHRHHHHARQDRLVDGQAIKPDDILAIGKQSVSTSANAVKNTGVYSSALETKGETSAIPFATSIPSATSTLKLSGYEKIPLVVAPTQSVTASNIFNAPIATAKPAPLFGSQSDHPVPRKGIVGQTSPIGTNKFYAGFYLGDQANPVWTHPYSLQWSRGTGNAKSWGLSVSHVEANQRIFGPDATANPVQYYINPIGVQSLIFSAAELGSSTLLTTDTLTASSANVNLLNGAGSKPAITLPMVQGMGFVTAIYDSVTPWIESSVYFKTITPLKSPKEGVSKYRIGLEDGNTWLLYATTNNGTGLALKAANSTRLAAPGFFSGIIQIAKNPGNDSQHETLYDRCAGSYATTSSTTGYVNGGYGSYSLTFRKGGNRSPLLMFMLPHHLESMTHETRDGLTGLHLGTTTKGVATAIVGDSWTFGEHELPNRLGFAPWSPISGCTKSLSTDAKAAINAAGATELSQDIDALTNQDSMYFSGKALGKSAAAIYAIHDLAGNVTLANAGLKKLKAAFERFSTNQQKFPLTYESAWGGVVSTAAFVTGDVNADFGNSYYNDHHFHWSYFIYTAAVIGYLDHSWLDTHKEWVNTLVRDCANPSAQDPYFPVSRSFDWYHGHSWAKGLFDSADGKDEESSSEDANLAYAVKMWGHVTHDKAMEGRGNIMLAVLKRSLRNYFLLESGNGNQPANFIGNKVTGILFENKVDHVTYFGTNVEYVQGIHMLPITASSAYTRGARFVAQEWRAFFDAGRVDKIDGGWRGILYANLALIDPKAAWKWFSGPEFDPKYLDGGASLTWYLALAAGLGGSP
ncbi:hypothetical protein MMC07_005546 [Pseudocyphellaria aurata]|nr:hypothetical protein [Pseudocyphellaria aurata]